MSFSYTLRESFSGFRRTKLSSILSIGTITISLILLGLFAVVTVNTSRLVESIRNRVEMEAFLEEPVTREEVDALRKSVQAIEGVDRVTYISKDEAAQIFKQEFGENISDVLDFNPLPPSLKISLKPQYRTASHAAAIYQQLTAVRGIESVTYRKALLELLDERTRAVHNVTLGLGLLISLSAIFLVSNTIRLAISAKRRLITTMEFVGATRGFIRLPFLLEGMIQGVLGGAVAAGIVFAVLHYGLRLLSEEIAEFGQMDPLFYLLMVAAGAALGLIGGLISVGRFIRTT